VASLKSIIATDARRLARGRLQVDHAPAGIQEVYEATHGHTDALHRKFQRGWLDLRRHFVEVFAREHGGLALEQVDVFFSPEGRARRLAVPGILKARLQIVRIRRTAVQLGAKESLGHLMHDTSANQGAVGRIGQAKRVFVVPLGAAVTEGAHLRGREHRAQIIQGRWLRRSRGDDPRLQLDGEASRQHGCLPVWSG
jgi:hypothetical protein